MESTLKNMVLTLLIITLAAAAVVGFAYDLTKGAIEQSKNNKTIEALSEVLPDFDNDPSQDTVSVNVDNIPVKVYTARKGGTITGYAVESLTKKGFSGDIKIMTGFKPNGEILNIVVLEQNETPGLGSKMTDPDNVLLVSFVGKNPSDLNIKVVKDGGDIDVITASTISSRAYTDAVERAYKAFQLVVLDQEIEEAEPIDFFAKVLPGYDNIPENESKSIIIGTDTLTVYQGRQGQSTIGYAVEAVSKEGYHGDIKILVGFTEKGEIINIAVLEQQESPGFGELIIEDENPLEESFRGQQPGKIKIALSEHGGDIDGISGSTITSEAYIQAVSKAYEGFKAYIKKESNE